jgi:hypothetical protein
VKLRTNAIWAAVRRKPLHASIAALIAAGGITSAIVSASANADQYSGCGYGYAGYGYSNYTFGYGTCSNNGNTGIVTTTTVAGSTTTTTLAPAPFPVPPPVGVTYGTPSSTTAGTQTKTATASNGGATAKVTVPAGALDNGATVSLYPADVSSSIKSQLPPGGYLVSFGVSWTGTQSSTQGVTLEIDDPNILPGDVVYVVGKDGKLKPVTATVSNGKVVITLFNDPLFVVARVPHISVTLNSGRIVGNYVKFRFSCMINTSCTVLARVNITRIAADGSISHVILASRKFEVGRGSSGTFRLPMTAAGKVLLHKTTGSQAVGLVTIVSGGARTGQRVLVRG